MVRGWVGAPGVRGGGWSWGRAVEHCCHLVAADLSYPAAAAPPCCCLLPAACCCRALQLADLRLHAVTYEELQAMEDSRLSSAAPGSPATVFEFAE